MSDRYDSLHFEAAAYARANAAEEKVKELAEENAALKERLARVVASCDHLVAWLYRIEGGDNPCTDEATLRRWAYEALTLNNAP